MKKLKKMISAGLVLTMTAALLAGCSGGSAGKNPSNADGGKGRYVEQDYGSPVAIDDNSYAYIQSISQLADGTIRAWVSDGSEMGFSIRDSADGGKTWADTTMNIAALQEMYKQDNKPDNNSYVYIGQLAFDAEGDMVFEYNVNVQTGNAHDMTTTYYSLTKDGKLAEIPLEIPGISKTQHYEYEEPVEETGDAAADMTDDAASDDTAAETGDTEETEEDGIIINEGGEDDGNDYQNYNGISKFKLIDNDNLFVLDYNGGIYHVSVSSGEVLDTIEGFDYVNDICICGSKLLIQSWDKIVEYDIKANKEVGEHADLAEIIQQARSSVTFSDNSKDDGLVYYVCSDGIYSYNLNDKTSTQLVDGKMSSLISPNSNVSNMIIKDDGDILLRFNDYSQNNSIETLLNFTYDAEAARRPDKELTLYSLNDDYSIRTLAAIFQKANPDVYVNVEYGVTYDNGITASDAIRTLNTEIMAGEGPDIIFLDGLPIDSYVEKGLLADVNDIIDPLLADGKLFENVATTYKLDDGKIYAIPTCFKMPVVVGKKATLDQINSLADFAKAAADFASKEHSKGAVFMESYSLISMIGDMMPVNSASWFNEDGSLNANNLKNYLNDIKTIYDAVYNTLSDEKKSELEQTLQYYVGKDANWDISWFGGGDPSWSSIYIMAGMQEIAIGSMSYQDSLQSLTSAMRENKEITYKQLPGSLDKVYVPSNIVGINSKSKDMETAKKFLSYLLSTEGQNSVDHYNGFSVNTESFDKGMIDPNSIDNPNYDPNVSTGGWGIEDENGNEFMLDMYWPSAEQIADFKAMINELSTPAYNDSMILTTILKDCIGCILGDDSIDDAVNQVVKDINIYLSE